MKERHEERDENRIHGTVKRQSQDDFKEIGKKT